MAPTGTGQTPPKNIFYAGAVASVVACVVAVLAWLGFNPSPSDPAPSFVVDSRQWEGPCHHGGCDVSAILRNTGTGEGSATATFHVSAPRGALLAECSVTVPRTAPNDATNVGCTAWSVGGALQDYFYARPNGEVFMSVTVNNP